MQVTKNTVLISAACLLKENKNKLYWFLIKSPEGDNWEIAKVLVRKGESSVRAILRLLGEKGGMTARVLEEAGRAGGAATINGKQVTERFLYYLILLKTAVPDTIGFPEFQWLEYSSAVRKLSSRRERAMLRAANQEYKNWKKKRKGMKEEDDNDSGLEILQEPISKEV